MLMMYCFSFESIFTTHSSEARFCHDSLPKAWSTHSLTLHTEFLRWCWRKRRHTRCFLLHQIPGIRRTIKGRILVSCNHHCIFSHLQIFYFFLKLLLNVHTTLCSVVPHELSGFRYEFLEHFLAEETWWTLFLFF